MGIILRAKNIGAWLSLHGTTVSGKVLSATELWDFLCTRYNVSLLYLQSHCDGCGTASWVMLALIWSIGGLVIARHKKIYAKILYLSQHTFTSSYVRIKTIIHHGHTRSKQDMRQGSKNVKETWGDVMVQGLWDRQFYTIIDVKRGDADADSYKYEPMTALLDRWETIKK